MCRSIAEASKCISCAEVLDGRGYQTRGSTTHVQVSNRCVRRAESIRHMHTGITRDSGINRAKVSDAGRYQTHAGSKCAEASNGQK